MARAFSGGERDRIDGKLREEAARRFGSGGCRKTTVDELAQAAGISKGAFYLFYPSKEALFYRVLMDYHARVRTTLIERIDAAAAGPEGLRPSDIADALVLAFREVESSFLPASLADGELEYLSSRLDEAVLASHQADDGDMVSAVFTRLPGLGETDMAFWGAMLRGIFTLTLHRREIGEPYYGRVVETMIRQTVAAMTAPKDGSL